MMKAVKPPHDMVSAKSRDEMEGFRKALMDMRHKLLAGISESPVPEALVTQTDIGDLIDQAGDERDRELSLLLSGRDKEKLMAINEALEKLNAGDYGICEECSEKIGPGRLKVLPLARLCVSCQSKFEKEASLLRKADEDLTYRGLAYSSGGDEEEA
jgi:DnaK suppressor protein